MMTIEECRNFYAQEVKANSVLTWDRGALATLISSSRRRPGALTAMKGNLLDFRTVRVLPYWFKLYPLY